MPDDEYKTISYAISQKAAGYMPYSTIALIPAYEPDERLSCLVQQLSENGFAVIVVDDGSGASYKNIFNKLNSCASVISYDVNRGKGNALKTGMRYLAMHDIPSTSVIVTLDSNGQHTVSDAKRVAEEARKHPKALTLCVRSFGKNTPIRSRFGNTITRVVYCLSTGVSVSDTQTGLRAFNAEMLPWLLSIDGDRYEYEMNMLTACPEFHIDISEVSIETIYCENNRGSHFRTLQDSFLVYRNILKFAASSLIGFVVDFTLYSLFNLALAAPLGAVLSTKVSNVAARVVSSALNFWIYKRLVFHNRNSLLKTGLQYFLLAACILVGNTLLLTFLSETIGINKYFAKLMTEIVFFVLSFLAQRFWIFANRRKNLKRNEK